MPQTRSSTASLHLFAQIAGDFDDLITGQRAVTEKTNRSQMSNAELDQFAKIEHTAFPFVAEITHVGGITQALARVLGDPSVGRIAIAGLVHSDVASPVAELRRSPEHVSVSRHGGKLHGFQHRRQQIPSDRPRFLHEP
jgi:hypothetical protein